MYENVLDLIKKDINWTKKIEIQSFAQYHNNSIPNSINCKMNYTSLIRYM
jgi:hypothetical protein